MPKASQSNEENSTNWLGDQQLLAKAKVEWYLFLVGVVVIYLAFIVVRRIIFPHLLGFVDDLLIDLLLGIAFLGLVPVATFLILFTATWSVGLGNRFITFKSAFATKVIPVRDIEHMRMISRGKACWIEVTLKGGKKKYFQFLNRMIEREVPQTVLKRWQWLDPEN